MESRFALLTPACRVVIFLEMCGNSARWKCDIDIFLFVTGVQSGVMAAWIEERSALVSSRASNCVSLLASWLNAHTDWLADWETRYAARVLAFHYCSIYCRIRVFASSSPCLAWSSFGFGFLVMPRETGSSESWSVAVGAANCKAAGCECESEIIRA